MEISQTKSSQRSFTLAGENLWAIWNTGSLKFKIYNLSEIHTVI